MFKPNTLFYVDGYKLSHKKMLAPGTTRLYGTWIPRSLKYFFRGAEKLVSMGQQLTWKWIHDEFEENFFRRGYIEKETDLLNERGYDNKFLIQNTKEGSLKFIKDMCLYLGMPYDGKHFEELWELGYLPVRIKSLPEGIETKSNIPHMTFINTIDRYAWLTLYLETILSSLSWKISTSASIALQYKRNVTEWVMKTDPEKSFLIPYMCHDFSARGLDPFSMLASGLGHASSFRGSDTLIVIPGARYFYNEPEDQVCIESVNASEHSVSTTKIFTCGEKQMIIDWLKEFPTGILSIVADTFDLWKLITEYLTDPEVKELILARDGKLVIRPDSGDPVDIICGVLRHPVPWTEEERNEPDRKGVIQLLWDIFGGTVNEKGYKVLDSHIGAIYGDSITLDRQVQIYRRLADKGFAATNIVLGVGSFTYQFNTRDTLGWAAKGSWFEIMPSCECSESEAIYCGSKCQKRTGYDIYKDPVTDDGTKKSLKGLQMVYQDDAGEYQVKSECTWKEEKSGLLQVIYEDGKFYNQTTLTEIRQRLEEIV